MEKNIEIQEFKKFWVVSVNNYLCDASFSGKDLKAKHFAPSFRKFDFIRSWDDLKYFTTRKEISNIQLACERLGIEIPKEPATDTTTVKHTSWELVKISTGWQVKKRYSPERMFNTDGSNAEPHEREEIIYECNAYPEATAKAKLIAASPDLLEALKGIIKAATETTKDLIGWDGAITLDNAIDICKAVILKAEQ